MRLARAKAIKSSTILRVVSTELRPPVGLMYSSNPASYNTGVSVINIPSCQGGAVASWSVDPALPDGLSLNASSGVITGTPTTLTASTVYTITATNTAGSTEALLTIEIVLRTENIVWDNLNGYSTANSNLTKIITTGFNSNAWSGSQIAVDNPISIAYKIPDDDFIFVGLTDESSNGSFEKLKFGVGLDHTQNSLSAFSGGTQIATGFTLWNTNDLIEISSDGSTVIVKKNGNTVYTFAASAAGLTLRPMVANYFSNVDLFTQAPTVTY